MIHFLKRWLSGRGAGRAQDAVQDSAVQDSVQVRVRSAVNGQHYLVNDIHPEMAANTLSQIHESIRLLCVSLSKHVAHDQAIFRIVRAVEDGLVISENPKKYPPGKQTSYSVNKKRIVMCIIDYKTSKPFDSNTLMYVALHELAHIGDDKWGHTDTFKRVFGVLLKEASRLYLWVPAPAGVYYCGINF